MHVIGCRRNLWCVLLIIWFLFGCSTICDLRFSLAAELEHQHENENEKGGVIPMEMVPKGKMGLMMMMDERRRKLGSFQICALCTCCGGGGKTYCLPSPCCYAINCNIPNRPFGYCSFAPKTCNCFGCHI